MEHRSDKIILLCSVATSVFFLLVYLDYVWFKSDLVVVGVIREIFTIPCFFAQAVLLLLASRAFYSSRFDVRSSAFVALFLTTITLTLILISHLYF